MSIQFYYRKLCSRFAGSQLIWEVGMFRAKEILTNPPCKQENVIKRGKYLRVILFQGRETYLVGEELEENVYPP